MTIWQSLGFGKQPIYTDDLRERVREAARQNVAASKNLEATINEFLDSFQHREQPPREH